MLFFFVATLFKKRDGQNDNCEIKMIFLLKATVHTLNKIDQKNKDYNGNFVD
jgi:hypothetical protein